MGLKSSFRKRIAGCYLKASVLGTHIIAVIAIESALILVAIIVALLIRLERMPSAGQIYAGLFLLVPICIAALAKYNLVRGWWRFTGLHEVIDLGKAAVLGTITYFFVHQCLLRSGVWHLEGWPFSTYVSEALLSSLLLSSARASARILAGTAKTTMSAPKRIIIVGAGAASTALIRDLQSFGGSFVVVGCVDDDPAKVGVRVHGIKILGPVDCLRDLVVTSRVDEVWIAIPSATPRQLKRFVEICSLTKIPFKTLPPLREIISGNYVKQVREINPVDLLERDPIRIDPAEVRARIGGRVVMVTGAAGSIGSELVSQLISCKPAVLVCVDQSETGIFYLELKNRVDQYSVPVLYRVADVCNTGRMGQIISELRVEIIFHAAAYKHVPVMESNVHEAISNNVLALRDFLNCADQLGVKSFVLISSDKAVNPTNVMGTTKRVGELIIASRPRSTMACVAVRFGNVLGSNGSVVPVFEEQIRRDDEVTITHPEIKRYFMTINEAVSLVLQAFTIGKHGDLLVLDMGEPVRIVDMARNMIRLSGKSEDEVKIRYIGLREGEKLREELFYDHEQVTSTEKAKVLRTRSKVIPWERLCRLLDELSVLSTSGSSSQLRSVLKRIVPEYDPMPEPATNKVTAAVIGGDSRQLHRVQ